MSIFTVILAVHLIWFVVKENWNSEFLIYKGKSSQMALMLRCLVTTFCYKRCCGDVTRGNDLVDQSREHFHLWGHSFVQRMSSENSIYCQIFRAVSRVLAMWLCRSSHQNIETRFPFLQSGLSLWLDLPTKCGKSKRMSNLNKGLEALWPSTQSLGSPMLCGQVTVILLEDEKP